MQAIKLKCNPPQNIIHPIPPYNGYGTEEDSLLNVMFLDPTEKNHEFYSDKFKKDKHILRFNAKLISSVPSDDERTFIVSFYVRDDAIMVYETAARNSGRQNCKFYEKQRVKNPYTNQYYTEKDFKTGNIIYVNKYIFKLLDSDEYTKKYMRDNPEVFSDSDIGKIKERIKVSANKFENIDDFLVRMLKAVDPEGKDFVPREDIAAGLKQLGIYLSTQEIITLGENIGKKGDCYSVEGLYNLIAN